ncbi:RVP domain-containing protein [Trichonephila clavipes]|nr:RVP domain-containing protein [Trichonephila clavipes]
MLLTGIGEAQVTTIGSFEHEFKIDDENYSLTWHVVPTDKLKFEAVIESDLLEQASISFTKEGVKFNKYENHAQLMQISAENLQEELDLRHVENRQSKKELEKVIQDYKPEKTASTDNENYSKRRRTSLSTPSSTSFHRKTRSKQTDRRMAQRRHYTSEFFRICKSNRNGRPRVTTPNEDRYLAVMGAEFLFMDDNARSHRANIVDECLQSEDITRMDWPAYSPDVNPIEHVGDMLDR